MPVQEFPLTVFLVHIQMKEKMIGITLFHKSKFIQFKLFYSSIVPLIFFCKISFRKKWNIKDFMVFTLVKALKLVPEVRFSFHLLLVCETLQLLIEAVI